MSNYHRGRALEYRTMALLSAAGYSVARTAGSHGAFDVIAWSRTGLVFCQVKGGRPPSPAERDALAETVVPANARKLVHVWRPRARVPEVLEL